MANTYLLLIDQLYIQPVQTPNPDEDGTEILDVITKIDYKNNIIYTQRIKSILGNLYSFKILDKDTVEFQVQGDLKSEKLYRVKL